MYGSARQAAASDIPPARPRGSRRRLVAALASEGGQPRRLAAVLRRSQPVMTALLAAREVAAPEWLVSAGAVRGAVWDALHDRPRTAMPRDVDLSFFDSIDLTPARDEAVEAALRRHAPDLPWEAKNQAAVHLWYPARFGIAVPPFSSCAEAIGTFPEVASCVGVRLLEDDDLLVVAPHGLDDLLAGTCRHNSARVSARFYVRPVDPGCSEKSGFARSLSGSPRR